MSRKKEYTLDDLLEDNIPLDIEDLLQETQKPPIPSLEEIPLERVLHWAIFSCRCCGRTFEAPASWPQPVFIKTKLLKYKNLTTQQLQDLPHESVEQDQETGEVFVKKLDNPWNPTDLPLTIHYHTHQIDRCLYCVSGRNFIPDQLELFESLEEKKDA